MRNAAGKFFQIFFQMVKTKTTTNNNTCNPNCSVGIDDLVSTIVAATANIGTNVISPVKHNFSLQLK